VVLYELLTGTTPLESKRLRDAGFPGLVMLITQEEPPRPSTRLSNSDNLPAIAAARKTETAKLPRLVKGELDWLVMKCLEKDRARRYETASGLAKDVERYLNDEPVEACPPSAGYRLRKFLRRHKGQVIAAAIVLVTLLAGICGTTTFMLVAMSEAEKHKRAAANANANYKFLVEDLFAASHYVSVPDPDLTVRADLEYAASQLERNANLPTATEMFLRQAIAQSYLGLTNYAGARQHAERAWELGRKHYGEKHLDTLWSAFYLAIAERHLGNLDRAETLVDQVLRACWAPEFGFNWLQYHTKAYRAYLYEDRGQPEKAEEHLRGAVDDFRARYGDGHAWMNLVHGELANCYLRHGKPQLAEPLCRLTVERSRQLFGKRDSQHAVYVFLLAKCHLQLGAPAQAEKLLRESIAIGGAANPGFGRGHLTDAYLGAAILAQGRHAEAEPLLLKGYESVRRPRSSPFWQQERIEALANLVRLYEAWGKTEEATKWQRHLDAAKQQPAKSL
jgi:non-specific serine/threonine protein kinase/serine/threonine-protein kinase